VPDVLDVARRELLDTANWYEARVDGLGARFLGAADRALGRRRRAEDL
jgi:hypothetical protein